MRLQWFSFSKPLSVYGRDPWEIEPQKTALPNIPEPYTFCRFKSMSSGR